MSMLSNLDLIRRVPLFAMLTPAQAELLADAVAKHRFKRGQVIVEQGKKSDALYIILSGRARVLMTDRKSREVILATLQPGDYIGEMSMIDNQPHSATVEAEIQTDVLVLGRKEFTRCLPENATMAYAVMQGLVRRLRHADQKIGSLALMGVYGRVANVLLESAVADDGRLMIRDKLSRQDIAKMVGASREMVSRVMKDFEEQGFIQTLDGGAILVNERRHIPR
ncbi:MAG: Crp/Fnr family transcriptional regulator [Rhodoferax sp.]|jgi:CRP/FNR family transcriptional regulator, cyclic AMP receptor protein|nr:Crp/Fnr family transcriptional regulator [Rhodoferax sp.]